MAVNGCMVGVKISLSLAQVGWMDGGGGVGRVCGGTCWFPPPPLFPTTAVVRNL